MGRKTTVVALPSSWWVHGVLDRRSRAWCRGGGGDALCPAAMHGTGVGRLHVQHDHGRRRAFTCRATIPPPRTRRIMRWATQPEGVGEGSSAVECCATARSHILGLLVPLLPRLRSNTAAALPSAPRRRRGRRWAPRRAARQPLGCPPAPAAAAAGEIAVLRPQPRSPALRAVAAALPHLPLPAPGRPGGMGAAMHLACRASPPLVYSCPSTLSSKSPPPGRTTMMRSTRSLTRGSLMRGMTRTRARCVCVCVFAHVAGGGGAWRVRRSRRCEAVAVRRG